ncbi:MAG: DOMON-like domain-containing protein [Gammaproteobacteria bacterium]|nr:DOMON-like domain-containing protein [Rhodocyclaceae bacterium]MBU3908337.1 DOMON-like domain-containing protein [Gammaproteobacteria bacterium]MBU3987846.1 DOMON-like domain-containing protein [Gammaproteobacteria bacterium]MBU4004047.1 DOMON-like domain-containing protein [Gammaproteobacteria bacterium]MBU4020294.1 DOMON-like domain-containing protein [Gammaproteobacteria bacterium]
MVLALHAELAGHPANPACFTQRIDVTPARSATGGLTLGYAVRGRISQLRIPTPHAPASAATLWRHTCCEIFIGTASDPSYREFNFSPSGQWASYDFFDYRQRAPAAPHCPPPQIQVSCMEDLLQLDVMLAPEALPPADALHIALAVVLEADDGSLGYWALAHPAGPADFHQRGGFMLNLGPAGFHS